MIENSNEIFTMFYLPGKDGKQGRFARCSEPLKAFIQYKSFRIDLLSGERQNAEASELLKEMEGEDLLDSRTLPKVFHLFYEFGYLAKGMESSLKENIPLAIIIEYSKVKSAPKDDVAGTYLEKVELEASQYPRFKDYKKSFNAGMERLLAGDCYQFNLTCPFFFKVDPEVDAPKFIAKAWSDPEKIGAYAHCTYVGTLNKLFFSNTPECLFQIKKDSREEKDSFIYSMPIKGTAKASEKQSRAKAWKRLKDSAKDQAELFMITDLIRNDLTAVQMNPSKIISKKLRLDVPGIVHQYSLVAAKADKGLNLAQAVKALFPGGSITGAPKTRVMKILNELESFDRGFYCGSTVFLHKSIRAASINIRSCEFDDSINELKYCAGGGVTLNSTSEDEFSEIFTKVQSFLQILKE